MKKKAAKGKARERKGKERKGKERKEANSLPELLALIRGQLGRARTHDGVRGRDVDLFGPVCCRNILAFITPSLPFSLLHPTYSNPMQSKANISYDTLERRERYRWMSGWIASRP